MDNKPSDQPRPWPPDEAGPVMLSVPIGNYSETDLMAALDSLVCQWGTHNCNPLGDAAKARAVNWLQSKYGSRP